MNKSSIIILIIAAVVFTGLGFAVGNVLAEGRVPGSADDPVVTESYVDKKVGSAMTELQNQIEDIQALLQGNSGTQTPDDTDDNNSSDNNNSDTTTKTVTVNADSVNIRASASTSAEILTSASRNTQLVYLDQTTANGVVWYKVRTNGGVEGYIHSDYCTAPE